MENGLRLCAKPRNTAAQAGLSRVEMPQAAMEAVATTRPRGRGMTQGRNVGK